MTLVDFIQDFGKYLLTGLVTFAASSFYAEHQIEPRRNVSLVPLLISIDIDKEACIVDRNKLKDAIELVGPAEATSSPIRTYESYVKALSSEDLGSQILKSNVPVELLTQLEKEGILNCKKQDSQYTVFTLQTAALLDQPTTYILKRSCQLVYEDEIIPIRASTGTSGGVTELLTIRETINLIFHYDMGKLVEIEQTKFNKLLRSMNTHRTSTKLRAVQEGMSSVELSVKCFVISPEENIEIGGQRIYPVELQNR